MVQIHGDIFVTRCSRCHFKRRDYEHEQENVVRDARSARSYAQASSGSENNCHGTSCSELKPISIAELVTL